MSLYDFRGIDLITATKKMTKEEYKGTIPLSFSHALSQVDIKVKQNPTADHRIDIIGYYLRVSNGRYGIYSFNDSTWTENTPYGITGIVDGKIRVGEEPLSLVREGRNLYITPTELNFLRFDLKEGRAESQWTELRLYAKVYNEKGQTIFPAGNETTTSGRIPGSIITSPIKTNYGIDISGWGCMHIQLGKENLRIEPGHKYVFNIDFTFGAGYYDPQDSTEPYGPILKNPICADVTVEDWTSTELDDMEQN